MNARESDPFHDDNLTQEEFEAAMNANFPLITIPDPVAVGKWLDERLPNCHGCSASFGRTGWTASHWTDGIWTYGQGGLPEDVLSDIRRQLAENDPLAKLRKDAGALGYALAELPK